MGDEDVSRDDMHNRLVFEQKKRNGSTESYFNYYPSSLCSVQDEIYFQINEEDCIYIPMEAIINRDYAPIKKRMEEYFNWYYQTRPKQRDHTLSLLKHPLFLPVRKLLKNNEL